MLPKMKKFLLFLQFLLLSAVVFAQTNIVTGTITDATTGEPVVGASVRIKDGKTGVSADEKGNFKLQVSPNVILQISSIGYATIEINVKGTAPINVKLSVVNKQLSEVIVVGY